MELRQMLYKLIIKLVYILNITMLAKLLKNVILNYIYFMKIKIK
jgi:hypothetical protein